MKLRWAAVWVLVSLLLAVGMFNLSEHQLHLLCGLLAWVEINTIAYRLMFPKSK